MLDVTVAVGATPDDAEALAISITDVNEPPVANAGGPYTINVGESLN